MVRGAFFTPCEAMRFLPSFAESHGCDPVDECEVGTLRSLGEGGYASEGSALRSVWRGATAVRPGSIDGSPFGSRGEFLYTEDTTPKGIGRNTDKKIRISKSETNSNDQNYNVLNGEDRIWGFGIFQILDLFGC